MDLFGNLAQRRGYWKCHLSAWRKSGLSQAEYARQRKISPKSLSYWAQRSGKVGTLPGPAAPGTGSVPHSDCRKALQALAACGQEGPGSHHFDGARVEENTVPSVQFVSLPSHLVATPGPGHLPSCKLVVGVGSRFRVTVPDGFSAENLEQVLRILVRLP